MPGSRYKKLFAVFKDRFGKHFNVFGSVPDTLDDFTLLFLVCAAIICDAYFFGELEYIEKTMQLNEFPKVIVKKAIHETLSKSKPSKKKNEDDEYAIRMYMPYEKGISENIARIGKKFNVKLVHTKGKSLKNMFVRNITTSLEKQKQSGVVYRVTCGDCGSQYVGETGRSLETRMDEHRQDAEGEVEKISGLSEHLRQTMHKANFYDVDFLNKESNFIKRKFKEAIAIKKNNAPLLNKNDEIKAISNVWENII